MEISHILLMAIGLALLTGGAELLVRGASRLAAYAGISPLVIGLTVVAYGTSAPELAVSFTSALAGQSDIAFGNVVGSNTFNVLFILGICALIQPLKVSMQLVRLDVPIMVVTSLAIAIMSLDGRINRTDGVVLVTAIVAYTVFSIVKSRKESLSVRREYAHEFGAKPRSPDQVGVCVFQVLIGLAMLVAGSRWLVEGAVAFARLMGISELVIGLTIIAAGTSLPEVATSIIATVRGERDIAVGNIVGSNIFNILSVLGFSALVAPDGVIVSRAALVYDLPVMLAVSVACLPVFFTGASIARWEGAVFLGYYVFYTLQLIARATGSQGTLTFLTMAGFIIVPATVVVLCLSVWQAITPPRKGAS